MSDSREYLASPAHAAARTPVVIRRERSPAPAENPGFLAQARASSYAATQDLIIPKETVYRQIFSQIDWAPDRVLRFVEFGFGTGAFLHRLARTLIDRNQAAEIVAFDLSPAMGDLAKHQLDALLSGPHIPRDLPKISVTLRTGTNCLDPAFSPIEFSVDAPVDAIFQMQFSHYAPNSAESWLGHKTRGDGVPKVTKWEWLRRVHAWLRPGGSLFDFDDFDTGCALTNEISFTAWDLWVLRQLTDPALQERIARIDPALATSIAERYPPDAPIADLLEVVRRHRRNRRFTCREEVAPLNLYLGWCAEIFGDSATRVLENVIGFSHHRFHLVHARRK